jgi:hypothetical protein
MNLRRWLKLEVMSASAATNVRHNSSNGHLCICHRIPADQIAQVESLIQLVDLSSSSSSHKRKYAQIANASVS